MLTEIAITDFAIIQSLRLSLTAGLVIFTGETGAGKSIVLDAIGTLLGDRMSAEVVRAGAQRALVEGIFVLPWLPTAINDLSGSEVESAADESDRPDARHVLAALLQEFGLHSDDETLIITREVTLAGRSMARVNGRAVPANVLARLGALLVDVHGQGAHLTLLRPEQHVNYLDRFADTLAQRQQLAEAVRRWQAQRRELAALRSDEREIARRLELLRFQSDEINGAQLQVGEVETLEHERVLLGSAERLGELSELAHAALTGAEDGETPGALDLLATAERALNDIVRLDSALTETQMQLAESRFRLEDVAATLRAYRDSSEANPERLAEIEDRLDRIVRLRRKYGATIEEVLAYGANVATELEDLEHRDERSEQLTGEIERSRVVLGTLAAQLSDQRRQAAANLATVMEAALDRLNMQRARFAVDLALQPNEDGVPAPLSQPAGRVAITTSGIDRVEFLIAPNPGEPLRPLARIASGGETARLMLALKSILAQADTIPTLIFDEVDAGISGISGQIVGEMLWQLGREHQVICVTHLPQIAAFADQHWHVAKQVADERTTTVVTELDSAGRTLELAQMLGGVATESAARNAAELLDRAAQWKAGNTRPVVDELVTPPTNGAGTAARKRTTRSPSPRARAQ